MRDVTLVIGRGSCEGGAVRSLGRTAGVTLPLSAIRSSRDWGVGEIGDLPMCAAWLKTAGFGVLQLLPVYELADGETSPYGARTAFGLDPIFLSISDLGDLDGATSAAFLSEGDERERQRLASLDRVDFKAVRALKDKALARAFENFWAKEWASQTPRAKELIAFAEREAAWESDLSLYVAIREEQNRMGWESWSTALRYRDPASLADARERLAKRVLQHQYEQWQLAKQWGDARIAIESIGMKVMGDLPFVVGRESADVWAEQRLFQEGLSLGAPPDALTPQGQDWGLPPYDWKNLAESDFAWLRARVRHASRLYHAFRVDHLVGYFRQYVRKPNALGVFDPANEADQTEHGRVLLGVMAEAADGAELIAEDLGLIPKFVRETMSALGLPGYKVLLWERDDKTNALRDPATYEPASVATWSTHDTQPIGAWWDELEQKERAEVLALMKLDENATREAIDEGLFATLFRAGSSLALVLVTELLGERARINEPGTVGAHNWTYRLPMTVEALRVDADTLVRTRRFERQLVANHRA